MHSYLSTSPWNAEYLSIYLSLLCQALNCSGIVHVVNRNGMCLCKKERYGFHRFLVCFTNATSKLRERFQIHVTTHWVVNVNRVQSASFFKHKELYHLHSTKYRCTYTQLLFVKIEGRRATQITNIKRCISDNTRHCSLIPGTRWNLYMFI